VKVTLSCCLCAETVEIETPTPEGWAIRYEDIDAENCFCPKHQPIQFFAISQCPGCTGGWMDCPMWRAFAYSHSRDVTNADLAKIELGICPRRVNGTMTFSAADGFKDENLSERAPAESGVAFAQAIREYCATYPAKKMPWGWS
jgi:hypothetical protein